MNCHTCPRDLWPHEIKLGYRRCRYCRTEHPRLTQISDKRCKVCGEQLTACYAKQGYSRCKACVRANPGPSKPKGTRKAIPKPSTPWRDNSYQRPKKAKPDSSTGVSWWLGLDRAAFSARAAQLDPSRRTA